MSTYTDASLIVTPNAKKADKLYALKGADLDVVRATTATYVGSDGLIKTALANEVRFDYTNGSCPSILVEEQRTNLFLRSEEFNEAVWIKSVSTISANATTAPDGSLTADKFIANATNSTHQLLQATDSNAYVFSVYAKAGEETVFSMWIANASKRAEFNLATGTIPLSTVTNSTIVDVGNGWYRCSVYDTLPSTTYRIYGRTGEVYLGNGVDGLFLWGAQLEAGSYATSYIPTVASAVTRNADVISKTGISSLIGQTEGTLFIDFNNQNLNSTLLCLNKNNTNSLFLTTPGGTSISARAYANSVSISATIGGYTTFNQKIKVCFKYGSFGLKLFVNGELKATNTSPIVFTASLSSLNLNDDVVLNSNSTIKNNGVLIFPTQLTDAQCLSLTTL